MDYNPFLSGKYADLKDGGWGKRPANIGVATQGTQAPPGPGCLVVISWPPSAPSTLVSLATASHLSLCYAWHFPGSEDHCYRIPGGAGHGPSPADPGSAAAFSCEETVAVSGRVECTSSP